VTLSPKFILEKALQHDIPPAIFSTIFYEAPLTEVYGQLIGIKCVLLNPLLLFDLTNEPLISVGDPILTLSDK